MSEIDELRADLEQLRLQVAAVQTATNAIAHIVVQALETNAIASRVQIAASIVNSISEDDSEANAITRCLMLRFAETILAHPNRASPPARPALRMIDGKKGI